MRESVSMARKKSRKRHGSFSRKRERGGAKEARGGE
jgi:hypothetical protein